MWIEQGGKVLQSASWVTVEDGFAGKSEQQVKHEQTVEEGTPKVERLEILVARYSLDFSWVCEQMLEKWLAQ